jgi:hypothetical protein
MSEEKRDSIRDAFSNYMKAAASGDAAIQESKLIGCLNKFKDNWTDERKKHHDNKWVDNIAFYAGDHDARMGNSQSNYRVRVRENHTNNIINRLLSIIVQNLPITRVFPNTTASDDVRNAETAEMWAKYLWRTKKLEMKWMKFVKYALIMGNGFFIRRWDPDLGGKLVLSESETNSGSDEVTTYRGDVRADIADPFKLAFRPGIDEMDDHYDCIHSEPVSRASIEDKYGSIDAKGISAMNAYTGETRQDDEMIMINHYYHKPTPWFEEGMYACWAGSKLLKCRAATESETILPVVHLPFDKAPMKFFGMAPIEQIMDMQEQLDRAASMIVEARNLMYRPRVLAPNQCKVPGQSLSDRPGEIIRFDAVNGLMPKFETPGFNFTEMANHKADLRNGMSQVSGITTASRGEIPNAARTALALQLVLEQDRSQYLPFIKTLFQCILDSMQGLLMTSAEFIDEEDPRAIKIEGAVVQSRLFHGGMVPTPLDMYLEDTNPLGWTAGGRVEQIGELIKFGILKDRSQVLEMLKINSPDPAFEFININRTTAQQEIELLNKGQVLEIGPEDDDAVHLEEHTKIPAGFNYRKLPEQVRMAHEDHIKAHKERIKAAMQSQAAQSQGGMPAPASQATPEQLAAVQAPANPAGSMEKLLSKPR